MSLPIKPFTTTEVVELLAHTKVRKAPGYELISGTVLQKLPPKSITFLTIIYNIIPLLSYYPLLWKFVQIIMVPKPGKPVAEVTSYRSISLLPILSKVFEKLLLKGSVEISTSLHSYPINNLASEPDTLPSTKHIVSPRRSPKY